MKMLRGPWKAVTGMGTHAGAEEATIGETCRIVKGWWGSNH